MNRILMALTFALLFVTGIACADTTTTMGTAQQFASSLTPPATDYSVAYLSQIFGTVGNVLQGTSGQILGKMFDIFNKGVLVVAALYLCMTTVQVSLRAATEGSFMGQNKSVHMIMLRIALGFGLLIPSSTTGYSILQDVFMKIVVASVGLADQTWDAALNYLQYGGQLYFPPGNMGNDVQYVQNFLGTSNALGAATRVFQSELCMLSASGKTSKYSPIYTSGMIGFPGGTDSTSQYVDPTLASCGYVHMYCADSSKCPKAGSTNPTHAAEYEYSISALRQLVLALLPAAQNYFDNKCYVAGNQTCSTQVMKNVGKSVFSALMEYANLITPYQNLINQSGSNDQSNNQLNFFSKARTEGWIMAGGFYWNVEQANRDAQNLSISNLLPTGPALSKATPQGLLSQSAADMTLGRGNVGGTIFNQVNQLWRQYINAQQDTGTARASGGVGTSTGPAGAIAGNALSDAVSNLYDLGQSKGYNPIVILMHMGNSLMITVVVIWWEAIGLTTMLAAGAGICNSMSPTGLMFKSVMGWVKSIIMLITTALMVPGAIMAYYIPMYPFAVFTFSVIGWFGMVIEGMAAAPLVCFGMTHPEGHDFMGKAEQALMLFLSIFLRPTLMVIGLIAFMITSFVAFEMLITGFGTLMNAFRSSHSGALSDDFLILISIAMVMVIFGMMTMEVIEQCAKLIYQVPNNINKWIGAPGMGEEYGQMAAAIKGSVSTTAETAGKLGSETVGAGMQGVVDQKAVSQEEIDRRKNKEGGGNISK